MFPDSKPPTARSLSRINFRVPGETFEAVDVSRSARPAARPRNTWIAEAIEEKLTRVQREGVGAHGISNDA